MIRRFVFQWLSSSWRAEQNGRGLPGTRYSSGRQRGAKAICYRDDNAWVRNSVYGVFSAKGYL